MADLTPKEIEDLIRQLDDVCRQAQDLQQQLRQKMLDRARAEYGDPLGVPERRGRPDTRKS